MRKLLIVSFLLLVLLPVIAYGQTPTHIALFGFSFYTAPEVVGTNVTVVGFLEPPVGFNLPFTSNFAGNEYTFVLSLQISGKVVDLFTTTYTYANAPLAIYEDPSKNGSYGTNPPNATSPSTFQNGTAALTGTVLGLTRIDWNAGFPEPTVVGTVNFTGGSKLGELTQAKNGWTIQGGLSSSPLAGIPMGYKRKWATKIVPPAPTPVEHSTWGEIKALYEAKQ